MANFDYCYNFMMGNEDAGRSCAIVNDTGGHAISGVNSASFPVQFAAIAALPQSQRAPAVENFYQTEFWNQWYAQMLSDDVAARVFDAAVNMGPGTAVKLLQRAVNSINSANGQVTVDGGWGPNTVAAANATDQVTLLAAFRRQRENYYVGLGGPFLPEWLARAAK